MQPELHDCLLWLKVLIGVITGLIWGFYVDGATGLIAGIAIMTGITALFVQTYLRIDDEAYGGLGSLLLDSAYVAIAAFLVRTFHPCLQLAIIGLELPHKCERTLQM